MNKFNQLYEECLQEILRENQGPFGNKDIRKISEIIELGWKNEISKLSNLTDTFDSYKINFDKLISSPEIYYFEKEYINNETKEPTIIKWKIRPKLELYRKHDIDFVIISASVVYPDILSFNTLPKVKLKLNVNDNKYDKFFKSKEEKRNYMWNQKLKLNEDTPIDIVLTINGDAEYSNLIQTFNKIQVFSQHEASHYYDYIINRNMSYRTEKRYAYSCNPIKDDKSGKMIYRTEDGKLMNPTQVAKNYYIDVEMNALLAGAAKEILQLKTKNITFDNALNGSKEWLKIRHGIKSESQLRRLRNKLYYVWYEN